MSRLDTAGVLVSWLATGALLAGCGGTSVSDEPSIAGCGDFQPLATAADVARTPRENESAEILAIEAGELLVADEQLYQAVVAELDAINELNTLAHGIVPISPIQNDKLLVEVADSSESSVHDTLNCPNLAYGGEIEQIQLNTVTVDFAGKRYSPTVLAKEYAEQPNVTSAHQGGLANDGPDVCMQILGDEHVFIIDQASGDCMAGCSHHIYFGYAVTAGPTVKDLGTYEPAANAAQPSWYVQAEECRARL